MLSKAITLLNERKLEEALAILQNLVLEYPEDAVINYYCGCTHDSLGLEREAIKYYENAILYGIVEDKRERTFIQLGSTYRCIGEFNKAFEILSRGLKEFPQNKGIIIFYAMTLHNLSRSSEAISLLIELLCDSSDPWINNYKRALSFYSKQIDKTW